MCGEPSETLCVTSRTHSAPSCAAWQQALRATSPPIEWPTSAIWSAPPGQAATSSSISSLSERPFSEMWRPLFKRTYTGVHPSSRASRLP
jgi:hypothetical protein